MWSEGRECPFTAARYNDPAARILREAAKGVILCFQHNHGVSQRRVTNLAHHACYFSSNGAEATLFFDYE